MSFLLLTVRELCQTEKFSNMFPKNVNGSNMNIRNREKFCVNQAKTGRFRNSSIPFLQRKPNESAKNETKQLKALLQVNCVSHVDPIFENKTYYYYYYY